MRILAVVVSGRKMVNNLFWEESAMKLSSMKSLFRAIPESINDILVALLAGLIGIGSISFFIWWTIVYILPPADKSLRKAGVVVRTAKRIATDPNTVKISNTMALGYDTEEKDLFLIVFVLTAEPDSIKGWWQPYADPNEEKHTEGIQIEKFNSELDAGPYRYTYLAIIDTRVVSHQFEVTLACYSKDKKQEHWVRVFVNNNHVNQIYKGQDFIF